MRAYLVVGNNKYVLTGTLLHNHICIPPMSSYEFIDVATFGEDEDPSDVPVRQAFEVFRPAVRVSPPRSPCRYGTRAAPQYDLYRACYTRNSKHSMAEESNEARAAVIFSKPIPIPQLPKEEFNTQKSRRPPAGRFRQAQRVFV